MTGKLIGTLVCVALGFLAAQASAQSSAFGVEYSWGASLGVMEQSVQQSSLNRTYPGATIMNLIVKPFLKLDSAHDLRQDDIAAEYSRYSDPKFGLPQAFQRPRQMRLGFRIRF